VRQQPVERPSDFLNAISVAHAGVFSGFTSARPLRDSNLHPPNPKIDAPASGRRSGIQWLSDFLHSISFPCARAHLAPFRWPVPPKLQGKRGGPCVSKLWIACQIFLTQSRLPTLESSPAPRRHDPVVTATCVSRIQQHKVAASVSRASGAVPRGGRCSLRLSNFLNAILVLH